LKRATHIATALLVSALFVELAPPGCHSLLALLMYGAAVTLSQIGIDAFGHTWVTYKGERFPRRNLLHSLPGVVAWGLGFGAPFLLSCPLYTLGVVAGMLVHWAEDLVTEGGVYLGKSRVRLPFRVRYDDPLANRAAILAFTALFLLFLRDSALTLEGLGRPAGIYYLAVLVLSLLAFIAV